MAKINKTSFGNLYGTSGTTFPDNTTQEISEGDMRTFGNHIQDSVLFIDDHLIDEDDMSSDSATKVPSQQSVKAYVDAQVGGIESGSSGTYTPTLNNTSNISSSSVVANTFSYIQVGDVVTVHGAVNIDPTAVATTTLYISLPVASPGLTVLSGTATHWTLFNTGGIIAETITNTARLDFLARADTAQVWYVSFQYVVAP